MTDSRTEHGARENSLLKQLATFFISRKDGTDQIDIPEAIGNTIGNAIKEQANLQFFPAGEVSSVVTALDSVQPSLCRRLGDKTFAIIFGVLKASEKCWAQCRGLFLLTESLHAIESPSSRTQVASSLPAMEALVQRKQRLAKRILPYVLKHFSIDKESVKVRRGMGLLALELVRDVRLDQNEIAAAQNKGKTWDFLVHMMVEERNEQLRYIAGTVCRELLSNGLNGELLWPRNVDPATFEGFPIREYQDLEWTNAFTIYLTNLDHRAKSRPRQFFELATAFHIERQGILIGSPAVIFINVGPKELSILVSRHGSLVTQCFDICLSSVSDIVVTGLESSRSGKHKAQDLPASVEIHLAKKISPNYHDDAIGSTATVVKLTFEREAIAERLKASLLGERHAERKLGRSEVLDVSQIENENLIDDPTSRPDCREELSTIASQATRLVSDVVPNDRRGSTMQLQSARIIKPRNVAKVAKNSKALVAASALYGGTEVNRVQPASTQPHDKTSNQTSIPTRGINGDESTPIALGESSHSPETYSTTLPSTTHDSKVKDFANSKSIKQLPRPHPRLLHKKADTGQSGSTQHTPKRGRSTYRDSLPDESPAQVSASVKVRTMPREARSMSKPNGRTAAMEKSKAKAPANDSTLRTEPNTKDVFDVPPSPVPQTGLRANDPSKRVSKKPTRSTKRGHQAKNTLPLESPPTKAGSYKRAYTNGIAGPSKPFKAAKTKNGTVTAPSPIMAQESFEKPPSLSGGSGGEKLQQLHKPTSKVLSEKSVNGILSLDMGVEGNERDILNLERPSSERFIDRHGESTVKPPMAEPNRGSEDGLDSEVGQHSQYFDDAMAYSEPNDSRQPDDLPHNTDPYKVISSHEAVTKSNNVVRTPLQAKMAPKHRRPQRDGKSEEHGGAPSRDPLATKLETTMNLYLKPRPDNVRPKAVGDIILGKDDQEAALANLGDNIEVPIGPANFAKLAEVMDHQIIRSQNHSTSHHSDALLSLSNAERRVAKASESSGSMSANLGPRSNPPAGKRKAVEELEPRTSKRRSVSPSNTPRRVGVIFEQEINQQTTDEHTNRKPALISFSANGPRNQGVSSKKAISRKTEAISGPVQVQRNSIPDKGRLKRTQALAAIEYENSIPIRPETSKRVADAGSPPKKQKKDGNPATYGRLLRSASRGALSRSTPDDGAENISDSLPGSGHGFDPIPFYESPDKQKLQRSNTPPPVMLRDLTISLQQAPPVRRGTPNVLAADQVDYLHNSVAELAYPLSLSGHTIAPGLDKQFDQSNKENQPPKSHVQRAGANRPVTRQMSDELSTRGTQASFDQGISAPGVGLRVSQQKPRVIKQFYKAPQRPSSPHDPFAAPNSQTHDTALTLKLRHSSTRYQHKVDAADIVNKPEPSTVRADDPDKTLIPSDPESGDESSSGNSSDSNCSSTRKRVHSSQSPSEPSETSEDEEAAVDESESESGNDVVHSALAAVIKNVSKDMAQMERKIGHVFEEYENQSRKWMNELVTTHREIRSSREVASKEAAHKLDVAFKEAKNDLAEKMESVGHLNKQLGRQWGPKETDSEIASLWQVDFKKLDHILEVADEVF